MNSAADVGDPGGNRGLVSGAGQRRQRNDFAGIGELEQPVIGLTGHRAGPPHSGAGQPPGQVRLEFAETALFGHVSF